MTRLIIIRFYEAISRHFFLLIFPIFVFSILGILFQLVRQPQYLSGATIQIRDNDQISKVIGYQKYRPDKGSKRKNVGERMTWELEELMQTDAFVDNLISQVYIGNLEGDSSFAQPNNELRSYFRQNIEFYPTGSSQVVILAYMPTPTFAKDVVNAVYDQFLLHQNETYGGTGQDLVDFISIYLNEKTNHRNSVNEELNAYLKAHPEHPFYRRREIEEAQIALLVRARDDLTSDIERIDEIIDLGILVEGTSERYFDETFVLLDAPFEPVPMTTTTKKLSGVIQAVAVGVIISLMILAVTIIFDRRIILPLDLQNLTELPILTMVVMEKEGERRRYRIKEKQRSLKQKIQDRLQHLINVNTKTQHAFPYYQNRKLNKKVLNQWEHHLTDIN